jgi:hypothetical protein
VKETERKPLDPRSHSIRLSGIVPAARVTTNTDILEYSANSPGGRLSPTQSDGTKG